MCQTYVWVEPPEQRRSAWKPPHYKVLAQTRTRTRTVGVLRNFKSVILTPGPQEPHIWIYNEALYI